MKIIQLCSGYDIGYNGGITNYVRSLSESLSTSEHKVLVIDSQKEIRQQKYLFERIKLDKTILKPFHLNNMIDNSDSEILERMFSEFKPDIIHIHMMIDLPLSVINIAKKYSKVIISLHDYSFICNRITMVNSENNLCLNSTSGNKCNKCISKLEENKYTKFILKNAKINRENILYQMFPSYSNPNKHQYIKEAINDVNLLIAVSNRVKEIYVDNGLVNKNFIVNHIGNITADNFIQRKYENNNIITVGFMGYFSEYKGADLVLKFSKYLNKDKFRIKIFGRIDEKYLEQIELNEIISYEGIYQQSNISNILADIDLGLVLPIWEDNAPQVVFEFLNNGIPVIGTKMGGIPDFINHDNNGYLIKPDNDSIYQLSEIMNSDSFKKNLTFMISNLKPTKSVEKHNSEILEIYESIL
jgi:glycosyltransferase involved in cell wall biosynthesis